MTQITKPQKPRKVKTPIQPTLAQREAKLIKGLEAVVSYATLIGGVARIASEGLKEIRNKRNGVQE